MRESTAKSTPQSAQAFPARTEATVQNPHSTSTIVSVYQASKGSTVRLTSTNAPSLIHASITRYVSMGSTVSGECDGI